MDAKTPKPICAAPDWMLRSLEISEAQVDAGQRARDIIAPTKAARADRRKGQPLGPLHVMAGLDPAIHALSAAQPGST